MDSLGRRAVRQLASRIRFLLRRHPLLYRLRYAWIVELGGVDWTAHPDAQLWRPSDAAPSAYRQIVERLELGPGAAFDDVLRLADELSRGHLRGPGLGVDSVRALEAIYAGGAGVCSDYSQVFLGLCRAAGIPCREWGLTSTLDGPGVGHAVNEVFVAALGQWVFVDPFLSVYATARGGDRPLSMTEVVDRATDGTAEDVETHTIDPDAVPEHFRIGYASRYLQPGHLYFLLTDNDVFAQDRFLRWSGRLPTPVVHGSMLLAGAYQRFHVYTNRHNRRRVEAAVETAKRFGRRIAWTIAALAVAATAASLAALLGGD